MSMDSELLEPTSQWLLRLLLLLDQLLLLQLPWLHLWPLKRHLKWLLLELNILLLMLKPLQTVWRREKLSLLMEIMRFPLPLSYSCLSPLFTMLLPLSLTMWPSLPQLLLLLPSPIPTSFLLTKCLPLGSLPLFLPLLLNLSLTKLPLPLPLLLPQLPFPWLLQSQLLPLLSLLQASSMLRMSSDSSALATRTSTLARLKLRMLSE